jgi:DNA-binding response OmpR family regulator
MKARILVVDDEPDMAALIQQKFRHQISRRGHQLSVR